MKKIFTFEEFVNEQQINENWKVSFKTWPEIENDLEFLGKDELTDEDTGLTFNNKIPHHKAWVDVKGGNFKGWSFAIYSNGKEIMIHGNPEKGYGESFNVIQGDLKKAQEIADTLVKTGKLTHKDL